MEELNNNFFKACFNSDLSEAKRYLEKDSSFLYSFLKLFTKRYKIKLFYTDNGFPFDTKPDYDSLLRDACEKEDINLLKFLLHEKKLKKYKNRESEVFLISQASAQSKLAVLKYMLEESNYINDKRVVESAIVIATNNNKVDVLKYLVIDLGIKRETFESYSFIGQNKNLINSLFDKQELKDNLETKLSFNKKTTKLRMKI